MFRLVTFLGFFVLFLNHLCDSQVVSYDFDENKLVKALVNSAQPKVHLDICKRSFCGLFVDVLRLCSADVCDSIRIYQCCISAACKHQSKDLYARRFLFFTS